MTSQGKFFQVTFPFSLDERVEICFSPLTLDTTGFIFKEINVAHYLKRFCDESASRERKLPPRRFDLGSLDLKADALPIELAGPGNVFCLFWCLKCYLQCIINLRGWCLKLGKRVMALDWCLRLVKGWCPMLRKLRRLNRPRTNFWLELDLNRHLIDIFNPNSGIQNNHRGEID